MQKNISESKISNVETRGKGASEQLHALNLLKVLAILLVFNSHCGNLYPISAMATGGALGNALFFILSGYFVRIGEARFWPWLKKRIVQLYPPMLIVSVVYAVAFHVYPNGFLEFVDRFIWPTGYWFIGGLLLFNVVLFILEKLRVFDHFVPYSLVLWLVYFVYYMAFIDKTTWSVEDHGLFRLIYYFYIYSFGYCVRTNRVQLSIPTRLAALGSIAFFLGQIGWKAIMVKFPQMMATQCVCQLLGTLFAVFALATVLNIEDNYRRLPAMLIGAIDHWSRYSLEIYLTQRTAQHIGAMIGFPMNMAVAIGITLIYAVVLKWVTRVIGAKLA